MTLVDPQLASSLARRFRLIRQLGAGGMGAVYLAEQIAVGNRPVALKVLNRKLLDDPDFLLRFQNEAASTGRIHHPNVVTIYESGQADDGTPYIAMEFLEGESLRQALARRGALPVAEVAEILQQAARGLNAAHKLGIIHRDLKPDNIFLTYPDDSADALVGEGSALPDGRGALRAPAGGPSPPLPMPKLPDSAGLACQVKLVDFGIAKLRESGMHTQTGMVLGTPAYMSFEQASGMRSDELDARSDVYSLGVVVYEMLTGRLPFESDTPVGFLRKHLQDTPPPLQTVKPDLPALPDVENVVMKALAKDRDRRFASTLDFARGLTSAAHTSRREEAWGRIAETAFVLPPAPTVHCEEVKASPPRAHEEQTPITSRMPAPSDAQSRTGQMKNAGSHQNVRPNVVHGMAVQRSGSLAFLREPRYTWWIDLPLLGFALVMLVLRRPGPKQYPGMWSEFAGQVTGYILFSWSALVMTSRYIRKLEHYPAQPRPSMTIQLSVLAILVGMQLGHIPGGFRPGPDLLLVYCIGWAAVNMASLLIAAFRLRCRPWEWAVLSALVLLAAICFSLW